MAWYSGNMTAAAGELKAILDVNLILNPFWHIEDAGAGANIGVYHNDDPALASDFIFVVRDNQANYATVEVWQGWNSGIHAGTGDSLASANYTWRKFLSVWGLAVSDHRCIYVNYENAQAFYVGQLIRFDDTKNMPVLIACTSAYASNPLGFLWAAGNCYYLVLYDENGATGKFFRQWYPASGYIKTSNGKYYLLETPVFQTTSLLLLGLEEGVCWCGLANGLVNKDIVIDTASVEWLSVYSGAPYECLIRKA